MILNNVSFNLVLNGSKIPHLLLLLILLLLPISSALAAQVTVIIKQTSIRADKAFYAKTIGGAKFGDKLSVIKEKKNWFKVKFGKVTGWVHGSAVSTKKGSKSGGSSAVGSALGFLSGRPSSSDGQKSFDEDEVALAGKGFSAEVEGQYRGHNPSANFAAVDRLEKQQASDFRIAKFAQRGELKTRQVKARSFLSNSSNNSSDESLDDDY